MEELDRQAADWRDMRLRQSLIPQDWGRLERTAPVRPRRKKVTVALDVAARLLPRIFFVDARDDVGVRDEVFEEVAPVFRGAPRIREHVAQLFDSVVGQGGNRVVRELPPVSLDIALSERRSRWTSRGTPK
ncbi:hypothetical protein [Amaricoccus sp.]|uniref:hypothetical protein n=1 Tax=Amaricoccus sp. TaxID=1872485 RepID=UPI001B6C1C8F|nr:hypothetical protein [Amaricoccus sp.]MBP7243024.1 hypothetical protein [Amaricoccus sp.]